MGSSGGSRMHARPIAALAWLAAALAQTAAAQGLPVGDPAALGLSAERLERIDALIERGIEQRQITGAVALIARRGEVAYLKAIGMADVDDGEPMRADTIFRIASMTKPVTSLAVMMLYEEGRLLLTDPVARFIPALGNPEVLATGGTGAKTFPAEGEITIQQLLTHTSGVIYRFNGDAGARATLASLYREAGVSDGLSQTEGRVADLSARLGTVPLLFEPGTE
ncbi:MAG TPA: serine hydrolase domain-containing protein, partial [Gammaproteobacteria bacterium]|nr:serine hydrolase domain-containing protein [Gammaproteobacteria bacterium]